MRLFFLDTETTGNGERDRLCQLAVKGRPSTMLGADSETFTLNAIYKPPVPISIASMAVHHITEKAVAAAPAFRDAPEFGALKALLEDKSSVVVAHNAAFDLAMLAREGVTPARYVCTYKVARALDQEAVIESYQLQYLRYLLALDVEAAAHDAWGDVLVLEALFERLLAKMVEQEGSEAAALEKMLEISMQPVLYAVFPFGKYSGRAIAEVAREKPDYLEWLLREKRREPLGEEDWIYTLEYHLRERSGSQGAAGSVSDGAFL